MTSWYTTRPLGPWLEPLTPRDQRRSRYTFKASWPDTERLLEDELAHLDGRRVVMQIDVREQDLRIDGGLRANAKVDFPGVRIAFESIHGPLTYGTDAHEMWQHNVRGIALGLQALRAVDRYGVTKRGEQYTGWKALPAGQGAPASHMTSDQALKVLRRYASAPSNEATDDIGLERLARYARIGAHPDRRGGDHSASDEVLAAMAVLGIAS